MEVVTDISDLRSVVKNWRERNQSIAFVPTMGALHEGHLALLRRAQHFADKTVVSIFVNPTQFNDPNDLKNYPRTEAADIEILQNAGTHLLFMPSPKQIYPKGFLTKISVSQLTAQLCGAHRPGHFDGVSTIVAKLLNLVTPDQAVFGEKDYQQLVIIRRMVADLDLPIEIVSCPTVRHPDGLAMSSRNTRLTPREREIAPTLFKMLSTTAMQLSHGEAWPKLYQNAYNSLMSYGFDAPEYLEFRSETDLSPMTRATEPARVFVAAKLGAVRLIDNIHIAPRANT